MPSNVLKLAIIGGDLRQKKLAELLAHEKFKVKTFGLSIADGKIPCNLKKCTDYKKALYDSDVIIAGIPLSKDGVTVNAPDLGSNHSVSLQDIFTKMNEYGCSTLIAGVISQKVKDLAKEYSIRVVDLLDLDEMAVLNAIPTALHKEAQRLKIKG